MKRVLYFFEFLIFYLQEVLLSNLRVAYDVLTPSDRTNPAMLSISLEELTPRQVFVMSNLITMTPGTLSVDIHEDNRLLIHSMYVDDPKDEEFKLEKDFKRRVCRVF